MIEPLSGTAAWRRRAADADGEIMKSLPPINIICRPIKSRTRGKRNPTDYATTKTISLTLATRDRQAKNMNADDLISWKGQGYKVISIEEVSSGIGMGAIEYIISLE